MSLDPESNGTSMPPPAERVAISAPEETGVTRRGFLKTAAWGTGAFVIAFHLPGCSKTAPVAGAGATQPVSPNAWLTIAPDDTITFLCDRSEMGQGVYTALPTMIAEELGVDVAKIKIEFAPPGAEYTNALLGGQVTGGSTSVRDAWPKLLKAGAQAREMFVAAAAAGWEVPARDCRVVDGVVQGPRQDQRATYGSLVAAAAKQPVPTDPKLKPAADYSLIGKSRQRLDTPQKVDGSIGFGIDVKLPDMLYGSLAQSPTLGGQVKSFDAAAAKAMPGVRDVVQTSSGIAVVADSWWQARQARDALKIDWDPGPNAKLDNAAIRAGLKAASQQAGIVARKDGDADAALASAARVVKAEYDLPLLAHATLEPQNCTADVRADGCDVHVPTQVQGLAQAIAAKAAGLPPEKVRVHTTFLGGGFGRRLDVDFIPAAVEASKAVGRPVKVLWTREDDTTHDTYRPPAYDTVAGGFDSDGRLVAWKLHLTGPSITARVFPGAVPEGVADPFSIEAASNYPYDVPNVLVDYVRHEIGIDVGYWRSVSHALNCFVAESFMDELAAAAKQDPVAFRMLLLEKQPRYRAVLERATQEAGYGRAPAGRFHGVALMEGYGTYMAQVAEITLERGKARVQRIVCAYDCGQMVNPAIVTSQVESSIVFGLTAALWGDIELVDGQVQQKNFDRYRLLRLNELPSIETHLVASSEAPGGIGEPATALVAPAVCNAIRAATGKSLRSLPIARHGYA
jgi:isoquinoline 1-oxidoreductase beta subunit